MLPILVTAAKAGVREEACPRAAIAIEPGASIQAAVDRAANGAAFCLKNGVHRIQVVRPKSRQKFYGEGRTILNGARLLTSFSREGPYWVASGQKQRGRKAGHCRRATPACNLPDGVFIDDKPLVQVLNKNEVKPGTFYFDHAEEQIWIADDPTGHKVEATVAVFAFDGNASNVLISNVTIEKYASVAQFGAIQGQHAIGWIVQNCEVRLNSGAGIGLGTDSRASGCDVHHNGQIGIVGLGRAILIEGNQVWANNTRGFSYQWEAGGVKVALSNGVVFRNNHVYENEGPGLWCDINCRDVFYEGNVVERNIGTGIFHEISFKATIRNNIVRHNGLAEAWEWVWGNDILIAGSRDVTVYGNTVEVSPGKCGIVMVDQSRPMEGPLRGNGRYKMQNNRVFDNTITFQGKPCAGGASDTTEGDENYSMITDGNNVFERNVYRVPHAIEGPWFYWGHETLDWQSVKGKGLERQGRLVLY